GGIIEPQIMLQWFVDVNKKIPSHNNKSLKELMLEPVRDGRIKIMPEHFEKVYFNWIENLRDWCISRQIWYGHRIPVWYKKEKIHVGLEAPEDEGWEQDSDTLDTWFSSGLWTFSTLGWPEDSAVDLKRFHPTNVINPGYEILFFWVARMILMSQYLVGEIPFRTVYLHGMLRDAKGQKFSKSLGNGIDPIQVIEEYGADALRMSLVIGIGPGADSKFDIQKVKAYKHFANKIWNISRFVLSNTEGWNGKKPDKLSEDDHLIITEFGDLIKDVTVDMDNYRFYLAAEKLYHYVWHNFADKIIEESKDKLKSDNKEIVESIQYTLRYVFENSLILLHPFMPFITEEIWTNIEKENLLMVTEWPKNN
ncbi:MAG: Valine-tRNA ligase, partial [Parcubacteria group bacterium GW2011_GWB1_40_5]